MNIANIFNNFNLVRIVYLLAGVFFILVAFMDKTWWMGIFGVCFLILSVFGKGSVTGNCDI